jgi:hypothetical protein
VHVLDFFVSESFLLLLFVLSSGLWSAHQKEKPPPPKHPPPHSLPRLQNGKHDGEPPPRSIRAERSEKYQEAEHGGAETIEVARQTVMKAEEFHEDEQGLLERMVRNLFFILLSFQLSDG